MLFKSGDNLELGALSFISKSEEITLYSAYIRTDQLKSLNKEKKIKQIIVRWEVRDLHQRASDLGLFQYCKENNIALYRNTRIHLKCMLNDNADVFFGSANITGRGIGEFASKYNYELNGIKEDIDFFDAVYLDKILSQSQYVSDELFKEIKEKVESLEDFTKQEEQYKEKEVDKGKRSQDFFLISQLPTFKKIESLYSVSKDVGSLTTLERKCISHDIATYGVKLDQTEEDFYKNLKHAFNSHPFIISLKEVIKNDARKSLNYGAVVRWITQNTTTVPTPVSWELKEQQVVNTLYNWICFFDENYVVERPNYSEVIFYKGN